MGFLIQTGKKNPDSVASHLTSTYLISRQRFLLRSSSQPTRSRVRTLALQSHSSSARQLAVEHPKPAALGLVASLSGTSSSGRLVHGRQSRPRSIPAAMKARTGKSLRKSSVARSGGAVSNC